ncbi:MAG: hypothetical protein HC825_04550 [Oscillatoriales cyanobacterium RM1_1_9]|nr:hypothetical protein [Oscillatoriales cyanobacterium SM2_3_0]NJO46449.1 hypothetical protein [Oscillatoriales cyanobacterium RM2_1_1]NJO71161.1 hypothetical protein [Oscillatoriales cyanobacterium RM1_1_9]
MTQQWKYSTLIFLGLVALTPASAIAESESQPLNPEVAPLENPRLMAPTVPQVTEAELRAACSAKRYDLLPIPFSDVSSTDWAFEAVMNLYYCIGLPPSFNPQRSDS